AEGGPDFGRVAAGREDGVLDAEAFLPFVEGEAGVLLCGRPSEGEGDEKMAKHDGGWYLDVDSGASLTLTSRGGGRGSSWPSCWPGCSRRSSTSSTSSRGCPRGTRCGPLRARRPARPA